jgi:hypothetical protein
MNLGDFFAGRGFFRLALCAVLSLSGSLLAQDIIENPGKPAAVNAGRTLKLEEIWRVTDESGAFYFKYPNRLRIAPDGLIFLQDNEELLAFSADGKFIRNLFKKGEGPGEMSPSFTYQIDDRELLIFDSGLRRLWRMDREGKFLGEIPMNKQVRRFFLGAYRNDLIFFREDAPVAKNGIPGFVDFPNMIVRVSKDGTSETDVQPFFFKRYQVSPGQGGMNWGNAIKAMSEEGRFVFGFHGRDYLIEVLDLEQKKFGKRFRRDFPRIPVPETKEEREWREGMKLPKADYQSAIINLIPEGSRLWAVTSIEDPDKGRLCDVFDAEGKYVDCFYLGAGRTLLRTAGNAIFVLESNKDETFRLVKYRIVG